MKLEVKKLTNTATLPNRAHATDAGADLFCDEKVIIGPGDKTLVSTGIAIKLPEGTFGYIRPRSGLAVKKGLHTLAGVVDEQYRGEVKICLYNTTKEVFVAEPGTKIAQLLVLPIYYPTIEEVKELNETTRGDGGFGSTDAKK